MEIQDIRRRNLQALIDSEYGGLQARFIDATLENQGEISAILNGKKSFGERKARSIERKTQKPTGWLDSSSEENSSQSTKASSEDLYLVYLTGQELSIITTYRESTKIGRDAIDSAASAARKTSIKLSAHELLTSNTTPAAVNER